MSTGVIDTGTDHLLADLTGGILTLTFNRPEARNALSSELLQALGSQLPMGKLIPRFGAWLSQEQGRRFVPAVT